MVFYLAPAPVCLATEYIISSVPGNLSEQHLCRCAEAGTLKMDSQAHNISRFC